MKPKYKKGDVVYVKDWPRGVYVAETKLAYKTWFSYKYLCEWTVNSDLDGRYKTAGFIRQRKIIGKV